MFLAVLFIGSGVTEDDSMVGTGDDYDSAFYVENTNNIFIKLAKVLDKCCYYVVDIVINGISSVFEVILGY